MKNRPFLRPKTRGSRGSDKLPDSGFGMRRGTGFQPYFRRMFCYPRCVATAIHRVIEAYRLHDVLQSKTRETALSGTSGVVNPAVVVSSLRVIGYGADVEQRADEIRGWLEAAKAAMPGFTRRKVQDWMILAGAKAMQGTERAHRRRGGFNRQVASLDCADQASSTKLAACDSSNISGRGRPYPFEGEWGSLTNGLPRSSRIVMFGSEGAWTFLHLEAA